jgi:membrane-associated phospholipid phosphatase
VVFELLREVTFALVTQPARWKPRSWVAVAAFGGCVVLAYIAKRRLQSLLAGPSIQATYVADTLGSGWAMIALGVVMLAIGYLLSSQRIIHAVIAFGVAGFWGWLSSAAGAFILAEARPRDGGAMHFFALDGHGVSGHACAAAVLLMTTRGTLLKQSSKTTRAFVTLALGAWTVFIAWSRVRMDMHFVWNVLLGAALGAYVAYVTTAISDEIAPSSSLARRHR